MSIELAQEHKRALIFYDYKKGLNQQQCYESLVSCFGEDIISLATVYRWYSEFARGRKSLADEPRQGRPVSAVTQENIDAVYDLVIEDPHITYDRIRESLGIGSAAIETILHDHLRLRKVCSRWVPHMLSLAQKEARIEFCKQNLHRFENGRSKGVFDIVTGDEAWFYHYDPETKRQSTVWVEEGEPPPTKVRRNRSLGKQMFAIFFRKSGIVQTVPLENRATVTAAWYTEVCLPKVFSSLQDSRPNTGLRGLLLHHDNAPAHTAGRTIDFLHDSGIGLMPHPPYSPDLAPCDFWLFPKLKEPLRGRDFADQTELKEAIEYQLGCLIKSDFSDCFDKWFDRMHKCIQVNGEYFEKI